MIKQEKAYTFLVTRSTKEKISIRRVEVRKSRLHAGAMGLFAFFGFMSLGFTGTLHSEAVAEVTAPVEAVATVEQESTQPPMELAASGTDADSGELVMPRDAVASEEVESPEQSPRAGASEPAPSRKLVRETADSRPFVAKSGGPSFKNANEEPLDDLPASGVAARVRQIRMLADPAYLPIRWAVRGKINNEFGYRRNPFGGRSYEFHGGIDIDGNYGDPVIAPANGIVIRAGWMGGYGNVIEIDHGYGLTTRYGHLSRIEVRVGDEITQGIRIGRVGSTGRSTGPHLHFEVRINDRAVNPRLFLSGRSPLEAE